MIFKTPVDLTASLNSLLQANASAGNLYTAFAEVAAEIKAADIKLLVKEVTLNYEDETLNKIAATKQKLMERRAFKQAKKYEELEWQLLRKNQKNPRFQPKPGTSFFEFRNNVIIAYLNKADSHERYLMQLIEEVFPAIPAHRSIAGCNH